MKIIANEVKCPKCGNHAVELTPDIKKPGFFDAGPNEGWVLHCDLDIEAFCPICHDYFSLTEKAEQKEELKG